MKHLFKATKMGWQMKKKEYGSTLMNIQQKMLSKSSKIIKELPTKVIHTQDTNTMDKNITI